MCVIACAGDLEWREKLTTKELADILRTDANMYLPEPEPSRLAADPAHLKDTRSQESGNNTGNIER